MHLHYRTYVGSECRSELAVIIEDCSKAKHYEQFKIRNKGNLN